MGVVKGVINGHAQGRGQWVWSMGVVIGCAQGRGHGFGCGRIRQKMQIVF